VDVAPGEEDAPGEHVDVGEVHGLLPWGPVVVGVGVGDPEEDGGASEPRDGQCRHHGEGAEHRHLHRAGAEKK
jgi:hypothetical protein